MLHSDWGAAGHKLSNGLSKSDRRKSALGVSAHDTRRHRRNQIFEDGFDFTLAAAKEEMAKLEGGFDKTKARALGGGPKRLLHNLLMWG